MTKYLPYKATANLKIPALLMRKKGELLLHMHDVESIQRVVPARGWVDGSVGKVLAI